MGAFPPATAGAPSRRPFSFVAGVALASAMAVLTAACRERPASSRVEAGPASASPSAPKPTREAPTEAWLGQWNGPEGTFLLITPRAGGYTAKIQSLDGPKTYEGIPAGDRIRFVRDGRTETIRAGSGDETGMKWLAGKKDCLVIRTGEGFCRD